MSSLVPNHALFQWETGRLVTAEHTMRRIMPMILATEHQPSITQVDSKRSNRQVLPDATPEPTSATSMPLSHCFRAPLCCRVACCQAWSQILKVSMQMGSSALTESLLQQVVHSFPASDSRAGHLLYTYRQCALMSLRVWAEPGSCLLPTAGSGSGSASSVSYEADLLSLIGQLSAEGGLLGMSFYIVVHSFPYVIDFRAEVPESVHAAMLALVAKYNPMFSFNAMDIELRRMQARSLIARLRALAATERQAEAGQALVRDAERLLSEAAGMVHYERILRLKLQLTWLELRLLTGQRQAALSEVRAALADLPEAEHSVSFHVRRAREWLAEVEADGPS